MTSRDLKIIEEMLGIKLPDFYVNTMVNYPFPKDSFADEFMLSRNLYSVETKNGIFEKNSNQFAIGSDGGECIYYIHLNGEDTVYVYDLEGSEHHQSIIADSWEEYLQYIEKVHLEIEEDEKLTNQRKRKWWPF